MDRDNELWLTHLRADGSVRDAALSDLRAALLRGLCGALSRRRPLDEAQLEDFVQEALVRVLDRLGQFEGRSRFVTWATSIAVRVAMSELRRRRWRDVRFGDLGADGKLSIENIADDDPRRPASSMMRRTMLATLDDVIRSELTDKQRAAIVAELKGMPQEEIARRLGSSRNAVYKLTHDARKRLKRGLERKGYAAADVATAFAE